MQTRIPLVLITLASGFSTPSAQAVELVEQTRTLETSSTSWGNLWDENQNPFFPDFDQPIFQYPVATADDAAAPGFEPWTASVQTQDPALPIVPAPSGSAQASQDSMASPGLLQASGAVQVLSDSYLMTPTQVQQINALVNPSVPYFYGTVDDTEGGRSHFSITFRVTEPTPYTLTGALDWSFAPPPLGSLPGDAVVQGFVELAEQGGSVLARTEIDCWPDSCPALDAPLDEAGTLPPGSYMLSAEVQGWASGYCYDAGSLSCFMPSGDASFDAQLSLGTEPVPALGPAASLVLALALAGIGWRMTRVAVR